MRRFYSLRLDKNIGNINVVSEALNLKPNNENSYWEYEIIETELDDGIEFINLFCSIIENKTDALKSIEILPSDFTIWFLYEYDGQCNMEFDSSQLSRLGKLGITLCISCWES